MNGLEFLHNEVTVHAGNCVSAWKQHNACESDMDYKGNSSNSFYIIITTLKQHT
jgi:hypothetical protein